MGNTPQSITLEIKVTITITIMITMMIMMMVININCKGPLTELPHNVGSREHLISKNIGRVSAVDSCFAIIV